MKYLVGSAHGTVYWDTLCVGPFEIANQAFGLSHPEMSLIPEDLKLTACFGIAAVASVSDEPLTSSFTGLLAFALPLNSDIATDIPPTTGDNPDGAPVVSNIFGLGPYSPQEHFLSVLLERPGMDRVPSILGIGAHPTNVLGNITASGSNWLNDLEYNEVSEYQVGTLFWALPVTGITAYVNGSALDIPLGRSLADPNIIDPIGVLDTGVPFIFGRTTLVDAFYGAYGIGPGSDGICKPLSRQSGFVTFD